jgi:hypothetical protein
MFSRFALPGSAFSPGKPVTGSASDKDSSSPLPFDQLPVDRAGQHRREIAEPVAQAGVRLAEFSPWRRQPHDAELEVLVIREPVTPTVLMTPALVAAPHAVKR